MGKVGLSEQSLCVWRAVVAAGPTGIGTVGVTDRLGRTLDATVVRRTLQNLYAQEYLDREGKGETALWKLTLDCKKPAGAEAPIWLTEQEEETGADQPRSTSGASSIMETDTPFSASSRSATAWPFPDTVRAAPRDRAMPGPIVDVAPDEFDCSISARGEMWIKSGPLDLHLPLCHVQKLIAYLDAVPTTTVIAAAMEVKKTGTTRRAAA